MHPFFNDLNYLASANWRRTKANQRAGHQYTWRRAMANQWTGHQYTRRRAMTNQRAGLLVSCAVIGRGRCYDNGCYSNGKRRPVSFDRR